MTGQRRTVRATLAVSVVVGLVYLVAVPLARPDQLAVATDVYYHAGAALLAGGDPYAVTPPGHPGFRYIYPPIVLLAFVPHVLTGSALAAYLLQTALNLVTAGALAVVIVSAIEDAGDRLPRRDRVLVWGVVLASVHSTSVLVMGQVNLQLALAIAVGAHLFERGRETHAGGVFALAAAVKVFPAVVGLWLLAQRRGRALVAAVGTGIASIAAGVLAFGVGPTATFFTAVVPAERQQDAFAGGLDPSVQFVTIRRPLAALAPGLDPDLISVVALALLVPVVAAALREMETPEGRLVGLLATLLGALAYLPLEPFYYGLLFYPLVVLLYRLDPGRVRTLFLAGTLALSAIVSYPVVERALALAPLAPGTATVIDGAARTVFTVVQPPLVGVGLLLAGCVLYQHDATTADSPDAAPLTTK